MGICSDAVCICVAEETKERRFEVEETNTCWKKVAQPNAVESSVGKEDVVLYQVSHLTIANGLQNHA